MGNRARTPVEYPGITLDHSWLDDALTTVIATRCTLFDRELVKAAPGGERGAANILTLHCVPGAA